MPSLLPLVALVLLVSGSALAAEQAGVSAAVKGQVALARAQVPGRPVSSGEEIFLQDSIRSGPRSGMQILLLDETVFTIGPDSELVVDEFVYDPATGAGKVSAAVTKGVFRFVTGKVARERPENMEIRLPAGTLGVRGTMAAGKADPLTKASVLVLLGEGQENDTGAPAGAIEVCNAGKCESAHRAGFAISIAGANDQPSEPFRMPLPDLKAITGAVSDPESAVDVAAGGGGTDVAAGPGSDADPRSASDVAGKTTQSGLDNAEKLREGLLRNDRRDQEIAEAAQDQTDEENLAAALRDAGPVVLPPELPEFPPISAEYTTLGQLDALAAAGERSAYYEDRGIPLIDGLAVLGSYDFLLSIDLQSRSAYLAFENIEIEDLNLYDRSLTQEFNYGEYPAELPAVYGVEGTLVGEGPCANGCQTVGAAVVLNQGGVAGAAAQVLEVLPDPSGETGAIITDPSRVIVPRSD